MDKSEKELYRMKAEILKAIAHPLRLAVLDLLSSKKRKSVSEIVKYLGTTQSNISRHLSVLKKTGIIDDEKVGLSRFYYLKIPCVINFSLCVKETLKEKIRWNKSLGKF